MRKRIKSDKPLPRYSYNLSPNGNIVVFVSKEVEDEKGFYDTNEFIANPDITEEMVKNNPDYYLNYGLGNITLEERTAALEDAVEEMAEVIFSD